MGVDRSRTATRVVGVFAAVGAVIALVGFRSFNLFQLFSIASAGYIAYISRKKFKYEVEILALVFLVLGVHRLFNWGNAGLLSIGEGILVSGAFVAIALVLRSE
ncbi:MAG: hypothetical protein K0B85_09330, partial [Coriobacteriia bacterium]|nr:hypothetical protein [Coriobacteriia bacterium]